MKRHAALQDLSRDHHNFLVHAQRLRVQNPRVSAEQARSAFLLFHESVVRHHFAEEERALLPFVQDSALAKRLLSEHEELLILVQNLAAGQPVDVELGQRLREHVRFEEDVLFAHLQEVLREEQMAELARVALGHRMAARPLAVGPERGEPCFL